MNEALIQRFIQLISINTGLHIREQDQEALAKKIWARLKFLRLSRPEDYYQLLAGNSQESNSLGDTLRELEWRELTRLLTTGESYFFRDKGQLNLLKNKIIPQLIEAKNSAINTKKGEKRTLRIWSAGCSTGEEPYSLAIIIREILTDWEDWNILILGTDINPKAIEKAKQGIYSPWSFRLVDHQLQTQYFHQRQTDWELDQKIRQMVTLRYGNLVKDSYPNSASDIYNMDLIICRNVFVYFEPQAIGLVVNKFYNTLVPGGYLLTGHTELYNQNLGGFQVKVFPESVLYQRSENGDSTNSVQYDVQFREVTAKVAKQEAPPTAAMPSEKLSAPLNQLLTNGFPNQLPNPAKLPEEILNNFPQFTTISTSLTPQSNSHPTTYHEILIQAEKFFHKKSYGDAIKQAEQVIALHPHNFGAYYLLAEAYANLGDYNKATYYCQQAIELDSISVLPYYLLAHIAEEKGDFEKTKSFLKRIIYLAPTSISAYLELGLIYKKEGNSTRAIKMLATGIELLKKLPPSTPVEHQGEVTAGELLRYVQKMLKE